MLDIDGARARACIGRPVRKEGDEGSEMAPLRDEGVDALTRLVTLEVTLDLTRIGLGPGVRGGAGERWFSEGSSGETWAREEGRSFG